VQLLAESLIKELNFLAGYEDRASLIELSMNFKAASEQHIFQPD